MSKNYEEIDWDKVIMLFNKYPGTIKSFCKEQEISTHQLYYHRKKNGLLDKNPIFYAISNNSTGFEETNTQNNLINSKNNQTNTPNSESPIKIQVGKAILHIENQIDEKTFSTRHRGTVLLCCNYLWCMINLTRGSFLCQEVQEKKLVQGDDLEE